MFHTINAIQFIFVQRFSTIYLKLLISLSFDNFFFTEKLDFGTREPTEEKRIYGQIGAASRRISV